ncbi:MAG TPA: hypothetical protein VGI39_19670 [Polyangiaceae bacterium]
MLLSCDRCFETIDVHTYDAPWEKGWSATRPICAPSLNGWRCPACVATTAGRPAAATMPKHSTGSPWSKGEPY